MKKDINSRTDIDIMMKVFYEKLLSDETISYIFTDVAKINIDEHLPVIADFWESVLLNKNVYHHNTLKIHLELAAKTSLTKSHFDTWLHYFTQTVDELFEGAIAILAKQRALSIATVMQIKILQAKK